MKIERALFQLYESTLHYVQQRGIEVEDVSSEFISSPDNPKVIRKSYICLKNAEGAPTIDEIVSDFRKVRQYAHVTVKQDKNDSTKVIHCYSLKVKNPSKCPLPDMSRKDDPDYRAAYKREAAAWRRKNIALIEEVQLYYMTND